MSRRPASRATAALAVLAVLAVLLLAGCDSSTAGHGTSAGPGPATAGSGAATASGGSPPAGSPTTAAAPTTAAPTATASAADGGNVSACADARCEVAVRAGTAIPVPATTTVRDVRVTAVTADRVTVTGHAIGDASSGFCTGQCDSTTTNGTFTIRLGADSRAVENGLSITVGHITAGTAVLTLAPAG